MADDDDREKYPGELLHQAALWGNAELVEDLLLNGDQVHFINSVDMHGRAALHGAATNSDETCTRILLQTGANPNMACGIRDHCKTPLHVAAELGNASTVRLLLEYGADILARDSEGLTATDVAERAGHSQVVDILRSAADEQEQKRQDSYLGLWHACSSANVEDATRILEELGSEAESVVNSISGGCNTLLYKACEDGHTDIVNLLLKFGADGRIHPVTHYSPLYIACYYGRKDIAKIMLEHFPELVREPTMEQWMPTHAAALGGHVEVLDLLLGHAYPASILQLFTDPSGKFEYMLPLDINARDVTGQSALYIAACLGHRAFVEALLKLRIWARPVLTAEEDDGKQTRTRVQSIVTRLNLASGGRAPPREVHLCPVQLDLRCGNETALHAAVRKRHYALAALLLKAGASPNVSAGDGDGGRSTTVLLEACSQGDSQMVDLLLRHGARDEDCAALRAAVQAGVDRLVSRLLALRAHRDPE